MTLEMKPEGERRRGRPRKRRYEDVEGDLREMQVAGWKSKAVDREVWRRIVEPVSYTHLQVR